MPDFPFEPQRWVIPAILLAALIGIPLALWWERRRASSAARRLDVLAEWRRLPASVQKAYDTAALDAAEAADRAAARAAERAVEEASRMNALYRP